MRSIGLFFLALLVVPSLLNAATVAIPIPNAQWAQISFPQDSSNRSIEELFSPFLSADEYDELWTLYSYNPATRSYVQTDISSAPDISLGYWVYQITGSEVAVQIAAARYGPPTDASVGCADAGGCYAVGLQSEAGVRTWNMAGYPFVAPQPLDRTRIRTQTGPCATGCTLPEANSEGEVFHDLYHYDGASGAYITVANAGLLSPFSGYWLAVLENASGPSLDWNIPVPVVELPDLTAIALDDAVSQLQQLGLSLGMVTYVASGEVPAGDVISTSPSSGTQVELGATVSLVVSTGDGVASLVPALANLTLENAESELAAANLALGSVRYVASDSIAEGLIVSQSLPAGDSVPAGSPVDVLVSLGPQGLRVKITSPASLSTLGVAEAQVQGTIAPDGASLQLNGVPVSHSSGQFSATVSLHEGHNVLVAAATLGGIQITDSAAVYVDMTSPIVTIESHEFGQAVYTNTVDISGMVNDIVRGTISQGDVSVTVNGQSAEVRNRHYLARDIPLVIGDNMVTVTATDSVGNSESASVLLHYQPASGLRLVTVSGDFQSGDAMSALAAPLVVRVEDDNGPVAGAPVVFRVVDGAGYLPNGTSSLITRALVINTDQNGLASTGFVVGARAGIANHRVRAALVGAENQVFFSASVNVGVATRLVVQSGSRQNGLVGQELPEPLVATVYDELGNLVENAPVLFEVLQGDGLFPNGAKSIELVTDSDGRVSTDYLLGAVTGYDSQRIGASLLSLSEDRRTPIVFFASAHAPDEGMDTTLAGVVLDNHDQPVPGVTMRVNGSNRQAISDENGQFLIAQMPVGPVRLIADGTTSDAGEYPKIGLDVYTVQSVNNKLPMPVYMVELDVQNAVLVGGSENVSVTAPSLPGVVVDVAANSVTFPDGSNEGYLSITPVDGTRLPMPYPGPIKPALVLTLQPSGAVFDPPARVSLPNVNAEPAGAQVEMFSYDHDLEEFVSIGIGTVSEDSTIIQSSIGSGIVKAGWFGGAPPQRPGPGPNPRDPPQPGCASSTECGQCMRRGSVPGGECLTCVADPSDRAECYTCSAEGVPIPTPEAEAECVACNPDGSAEYLSDIDCDDEKYCTTGDGAFPPEGEQPGADRCVDGTCTALPITSATAANPPAITTPLGAAATPIALIAVLEDSTGSTLYSDVIDDIALPALRLDRGATKAWNVIKSVTKLVEEARAWGLTEALLFSENARAFQTASPVGPLKPTLSASTTKKSLRYCCESTDSIEKHEVNSAKVNVGVKLPFRIVVPTPIPPIVGTLSGEVSLTASLEGSEIKGCEAAEDAPDCQGSLTTKVTGGATGSLGVAAGHPSVLSISGGLRYSVDYSSPVKFCNGDIIEEGGRLCLGPMRLTASVTVVTLTENLGSVSIPNTRFCPDNPFL